MAMIEKTFDISNSTWQYPYVVQISVPYAKNKPIADYLKNSNAPYLPYGYMICFKHDKDRLMFVLKFWKK
jgi:hypothetical protein